jgi:catechol 2,3-dioxygenase-like lactoylglutathione lyase family enzyme
MNAGQGSAWDLRTTLIATGALGGLVFVLTQLTGSDIDRAAAHVGYTAYAMVVFTLLGTVGAALATLRPRFALLGAVTTILSLLSFGALLVLAWRDGDILFGFGAGDRTNAKVLEITVLVASAGAFASALLLLTRRGDGAGTMLVAGAGIAAIAVLAILAILAAADSDVEIEPRPLAIIATVYVLAGALLFLLRLLPSGATVSAPSTGAVDGVDHVVIAVSDRVRADWFYRDVLGAEIVPIGEGRVAYGFGTQRLNVHQPGTEATPLAAIPVQPGNSDICLAWTGSAESALARLGQAGVEATGPLPRTGARGGGSSVYCRDPDGSLIELIAYPNWAGVS